VFSIPQATPEYGFILSDEETTFGLLLYPGQYYQSERACFKVEIERKTKAINIVTLPSDSGIKCYKLSLWLSKSSLEKVCQKIV
jgi:hypothetical protein